MKLFLKMCARNLIRFYYSTVLRSNIKFNSQEIRKVLVYAYAGLGNFILYTPTLKTIKRFVPQANFTLLHANDRGCHDVLSGSNLFEKHIIVKINADWWTKIKWIYKIRKEKYDLIIYAFHSNNRFLNFLTLFNNSKYRLGHISSPGWKHNWDFIHNIPVKMKSNQHEIDRDLTLAFALGIDKKYAFRNPIFCLSEVDRDWANNFLNQNNINKEKDIVISVHLGTSPAMRWKQWSWDKYIELCDKILEIPNTVIILQGSSVEKNLIEEFANKMIHRPIIAAGKTTVRQAAALIEKSEMLICNDSGLMHISVAVNTQVVAIYGPTDYTRTAPLGDKHTIVRKDLDCSPCYKMDGLEKVENCPYDYKCLNSISVDEVFEVITKKLRGN